MVNIEAIQEEIKKLREDVDRLKLLVDDEGELTKETLQAIEDARKTPESEYVELE